MAVPQAVATLVTAETNTNSNFLPTDLLKQQTRIEDKMAAKLIAGSAGVAESIVWVVCEGGGAWFDKSDERRLMAFAWDGVIEKENQMMDSVIDRLSVNESVKRPSNQGARLTLITDTLKEFRQTQLRMRVSSFSPSAEDSMVGLIMIMCDDYDLFPNVPAVMRKEYDSSETTQHDDKVRRLSRMFRRMPITRNQFCQTAGAMLRYTLCLQEGSAVTTRRLNQIQSDMARSKQGFLRYCMAHSDEIEHTLYGHYTNEKDVLVFDWLAYELQRIDSEQFVQIPEKDPKAQPKLTEEGQGAYYNLGD
jgi:hypothetical protein